MNGHDIPGCCGVYRGHAWTGMGRVIGMCMDIRNRSYNSFCLALQCTRSVLSCYGPQLETVRLHSRCAPSSLGTLPPRQQQDDNCALPSEEWSDGSIQQDSGTTAIYVALQIRMVITSLSPLLRSDTSYQKHLCHLPAPAAHPPLLCVPSHSS